MLIVVVKICYSKGEVKGRKGKSAGKMKGDKIELEALITVISAVLRTIGRFISVNVFVFKSITPR